MTQQKEINAQYARERLKQIDRMIVKIKAARTDAIARSNPQANERTREFERREVERYTAMLADMQAERAVLSRRAKV
ncbi:hypothetical protein CW696_06005 [ANME-2 cluster archaeon]|nr:MAG: hypothetical protein CW696_06005 [ANME-2 cluster archaeon]